jgi:subtilisin-like proprotein convertase family protein
MQVRPELEAAQFIQRCEVASSRKQKDARRAAHMDVRRKNLSSEPLNGAWKLRVNDNQTGDTGRIDTWSLTF